MNVTHTELVGDFVKLVPMEKIHIQELYEIGNDKAIWAHSPFTTIETIDDMKSIVEEALYQKQLGTEFPFVIISRENNKAIGSTRFMDISKDNKSLEIGWTWLNPTVWGTKVNVECKYLLLKYCFENLKTIRVQLKTDEENIRSQKAIERIGGVREGTLRNHMIRKDGTYRNSVFYSFIDTDWKYVKNKLQLLLCT
ncbi:GNAT family N-acetyltransferase [Bacillus alkalicellulosilyticus]|uniref:GNAT family N-acetyltransferase n=1 Tax=Alkalihalobacterium alkalicellulosilyticum TaxID=1912214 RepID=UPI000997F27F|nr:GNAT family protein [Bacillus alkalicellulosilyticus]